VGFFNLKKLRESKCLEQNCIFLELMQKLSYLLPVLREINCQRHEQFWTSAAHITDSVLCYIFISY